MYAVKLTQTHCKVHHFYGRILWKSDQVCKMSYQSKSWKAAKVNSEEIAQPQRFTLKFSYLRLGGVGFVGLVGVGVVVITSV